MEQPRLPARKRKSDPERKRELQRKWYRANRERLAAEALQRFRDNPEKVLAQQRAWYTRNRKMKLARNKKWREDNPEKVREQTKKQHEKRKGCPKHAAAHRARKAARKAQKRGSEVKNCPRVKELYEIARWLRKLGHDCHVDHIYPLSKGGPHTFENLRIIPAVENLRKGAQVPE